MLSVDEDGTLHHYLHSVVSDITGWNHPEDRLKRAFVQDEFILYIQSILKLAKGGDIRSHLEVFVRLREEEQNLTPPGAFLPIVEYYNLGPRLDLHILCKTLRWYKSASRKGNTIMHLNLCSATLADAQFVNAVEAELGANGVNGDCLCFEISEADFAMGKGIFDFVKKLKSANCLVAIGLPEKEDLPLDLIKMLNLDFIKIGNRLVRELEENKASAAKLRTIVRACQNIGVKTIAQNVERPRTLDMLIQLGVDYAQGYGISKPGPIKGPIRREARNNVA
jgi:EAL domain-containing protein (putative c-di-GMP-specific phosphodiesterase class I)